MLKQVFKKNLDKFDVTRKPLEMNTACRDTLGPIGIVLDLNIKEQNFTHNFIVCTKVKQNFILGLDFA